jgi:hypothetical protein
MTQTQLCAIDSASLANVRKTVNQMSILLIHKTLIRDGRALPSGAFMGYQCEEDIQKLSSIGDPSLMIEMLSS